MASELGSVALTKTVHAVSLTDIIFFVGTWSILVYILYKLKTDKLNFDFLKTYEQKQKFIKNLQHFVYWIYPLIIIIGIIIKILVFLQSV